MEALAFSWSGFRHLPVMSNTFAVRETETFLTTRANTIIWLMQKDLLASSLDPSRCTCSHFVQFGRITFGQIRPRPTAAFTFHLGCAFVLVSERMCADSLRECPFSSGKRATRVLTVLWPCKYLSVTHCRQMICRGIRRPAVSWEAGVCVCV